MRKIIALRIYEREDGINYSQKSRTVHLYPLPQLPVEDFLYIEDNFLSLKNYVSKMDIHEHEKKSILDKVAIAITIHFPKHFFEFTTIDWKY